MFNRILIYSSSTDEESLENNTLEIPRPEYVDKGYIYIGFGICLSGSITIIVICILIYLDYNKNLHTNTKNDLLILSNKNETYINRIKISGFYTITKNDKNKTYYQFKENAHIYFLETSQCDVLVVGGGGGGGGYSNCIGGKGGYGSGGDGNNKNIGGTNPIPYSGGGGGGGSTIGPGYGTNGASGTVIIGNCTKI